MQNSELLPCPFCGSVELNEQDVGSPESAIVCTKCGSGAMMMDWNRRAPGWVPIGGLEEYENVLLRNPKGDPVIGHRSGSRWYGYTALEWLEFEPTGFMPLPQAPEVEKP